MARRMAFPPGGGGTFGQQRKDKNSQFFHVFYLTFSDHGGMMDSRNEENVPLNQWEPPRIKMALGVYDTVFEIIELVECNHNHQGILPKLGLASNH